jgi:hypothetical protein
MTSNDHVMRLLAAGVPISLLCDLAEASGPPSRAIYLDEPAPGLDEVRAACVDLTAAVRRSAAGA